MNVAGDQRFVCARDIATTHRNMFYFGLSSIISKVFVAVFEHVIVSWKRYTAQKLLLF